MKRLIFFVLSLVFLSLPVFAQNQNIEFEIGKLITEIKVSEMDALHKSGATNIINIMKLVEQTVFKPAAMVIAKQMTETAKDIDQGYCLLNTNVQALGPLVLNEYHSGGIKGDDVYIVMGVVLALEMCGISLKEDRRELYGIFQKELMRGFLNYAYPDYKSELRVKSEYYEY